MRALATVETIVHIAAGTVLEQYSEVDCAGSSSRYSGHRRSSWASSIEIDWW
jgi:hypothetical protein